MISIQIHFNYKIFIQFLTSRIAVDYMFLTTVICENVVTFFNKNVHYIVRFFKSRTKTIIFNPIG